MRVTFRAASESDAETITEFNCQLAIETESKVLNRELVRQGVVNGLKLSPEVRYFVAESEGTVVGQLMMTREWSDWRNGWMIWLQSVYVTMAFRRSGIFRSLYHYSVETLQNESPVACIRLYVEHANTNAKACYSSLGFQNSGYEVLEIDLTQPSAGRPASRTRTIDQGEAE